MIQDADLGKDVRVLSAAVEVFARYGYAKATMDDVARAAGVSRAGLYLRFDSKKALVRAGAQLVLERALAAAAAALSASSGDVATRLDDAMSAYIGGLLEHINAGPHAAELLEATRLDVAGIVARADSELASMLTRALRAGVQAGEADLTRIGVSPESLVDFLIAAADALKRANPDLGQWRRRRSLLFSLLRAALVPTAPEGRA